MIHRLKCLFLYLLTAGTALAQHPDIDVLNYSFHITLSNESQTIQGLAEIEFEVMKDDLRTVTFDLIGRTGDSGMRVTRAHCDARGFEQGDSTVTLFLDAPTRHGQLLNVAIAYEGAPADGLLIGKNRYGLWTAFGDNWPNRARHWLPCVDHPSDKAYVQWAITAPSQYQVVAAGRRTETKDMLNGMRMTRYESTAPIATKVMVLGAGEFAVRPVSDGYGVSHESWVYPQEQDRGFKALNLAPLAADFFADMLGPMAYHKLAHVQSKTRYGGTENAGAIFYNEQAFDPGRETEGLIVHETAHQWFGDAVTESDWHQLWLSEGFATYLTHLWFEAKHGKTVFLNRLKEDRDAIIRFVHAEPQRPVLDTLCTAPTDLLNANSYEKGSWVLHMLRQRLGDAPFYEGLHQFYAAFKNGNATTADFRRIMERLSGQSLKPFFDQWLRRPGLPEMETLWRRTGSGVTVDIVQHQPGPNYVFDLELAMTCQGEEVLTKHIHITDRTQSFNWETDAPVIAIQADPHTRVLARFINTVEQHP